MTDRYDKTKVDGKTVTKNTAKFLAHAEQIYRVLGGKGSVQLVQGSFNGGGVAASAGTHDAGGAYDLWVSDGRFDLLEKACRLAGGAAWHRTPSQGPWNDHVHGAVLGEDGRSWGLDKQVQDYYAGLNGLKGHAVDTHWRPRVIVKFHYALYGVNLKNVAAESRKTKGWKKLPGVRRHQRALNIKTGAGLKIDGIYGPRTKEATKRWERQNGWKQDGIPGILSETILCAGLYQVR